MIIPTLIYTEVVTNKPFSTDKPLNYLSGVPSCQAANFRFLFTTFRRSAFLLLKLSIITHGTIGDFIVSSKLSTTTCTENTNMYYNVCILEL